MKTRNKFLLSLAMALLPFANVCINTLAGNIPLHVTIKDPTNNQPADPKSPVRVPNVSLEDYTFTFDASCLGCELQLLDENSVLVYSTTITSSTLVLPSTLSGEYELRLIPFSANYYYRGYITL